MLVLLYTLSNYYFMARNNPANAQKSDKSVKLLLSTLLLVGMARRVVQIYLQKIER